MSKTEYTPKRKWRIECTEEKLRLLRPRLTVK